MAKESKYVKLTQREHILKRSETYVGSKTTEKMKMYVIKDNDLKNIKVEKRDVNHNPAFIKLFDEILTNASDQAIRTNSVKMIKINIDDKKIMVENDGDTIPIKMHPKEKVYNAELIFSHLLTGENYDDNEQRTVGGRNGLGAKLVNVFSKKFKVECCDGKKLYRQWTKNNMKDIEEPEIIDISDQKPFTRITYYPDYSQFDFEVLTEDLKSIMYKRCLDVAAYIPNVRVSVDGKTIPVRKTSDFMRMHLPENADFFSETLDNGWEVGVAKSTEYGFESVSIVNGISTHKGGTHVNHVSLNLAKQISDKIRKNVDWPQVKQKLFLFLICQIPNPTFDTQTKENLTNRMTVDIHQNAEIKDITIKKIMKSDIVQSILEEIEVREKLSLKRMGGGKKSKVNLPKLVDANKAGSRESGKCSLVLTEGDSALSMAIAGMSVVGRDYYGAFPLKGKVLNVRDASVKKIKANDEIQNLLNITGLEFGKKYTDTSELRYGKVIIMTDQDVDGIHIKGLLMNFFENNWPELLKMDFLYEFITPILKAKKGKEVRNFYTLKEYKNWLSKNPKGWDIKYYKGLGTSTPKEAKEYFNQLNQHLLPFEWDTDKNHDYIDMVFNNKRSEDRKSWMLDIEPKDVEKYETPTPISSFINNEMITFSLSDNIRSIPDIYDGMKPSQRKILYTVISKNITKDYPVASLGGLIKSHTKYHHGEMSLEQGIVNLAQDFVGSNNISLLVPEGQFGTRLQGGKDAASSRYINTYINDITKVIFDKRDDDILNYLEEDGFKIEPERYKPIIPMILINGANGIGTGWSTDVPMYNPKDVIRVLENKINKKNSNKIHPWYNGFKGDIIEFEKGYITRGKWEYINTTTIDIKELPIGYWTQDFINYLHSLIENKFIKDFVDNSTETDVNIRINISRENMVKISTDEKLVKKLKLETRLYTSNMNLFVDGKIIKFDSPEEMIDVFYKKRLDDYKERKKVILNRLDSEYIKLDNQVNFIKMVIANKLKVNNRKKDLIIKDLEKNKFDLYNDSYDYLLNMSIYSLTKEKVDELTSKAKEKLSEYKALKRRKIEDIWLEDLSELKKML
jgi:DNA topoisomerase-2